MAEINTIIANEPKKVRGLRVDRLVFEEAGNNPNLVKS